MRSRSFGEIIAQRDAGYEAGCITDLDFKLFNMDEEDSYYETIKDYLVDGHFERGKKYSVISKTTCGLKSSFLHDLVTSLCTNDKFLRYTTDLQKPIVYYNMSSVDSRMLKRKLYSAKHFYGKKISGKICLLDAEEDIPRAIKQVTPDLVVIDGYTYLFNKAIFDDIDLSNTVLIVTGSYYDEKMRDFNFFDYILDFGRYSKLNKKDSLCGSAVSRIRVSFYNVQDRFYEYTYSFELLIENDSVYLKLNAYENYDMLKYIIKHIEIKDED